MPTRARTHADIDAMVDGRGRTLTAPRTFVRRLAAKLIDDDITDVGAMMAYYAVLALFPMLVFVVTLSLLVIDPKVVHQGVRLATEAMPEAVRASIASQVQRLIDTAGAGFAIGGAVFALWGASRGAASLGRALNTILGTTETRSWIRRQLIAIGLTLAVAVLVVLALGLLVAGPAAGHYVADRFGLGGAFDTIWSIGRWFGAGVLVLFVWALLFRYLPDTAQRFRVFTPGAIVGVVLWLAISYGFGVYLSHWNSYEMTYGTLGGAIVFLTWLWLSNIALLFGAEVNDVIADIRRDRHNSPDT